MHIKECSIHESGNRKSLKPWPFLRRLCHTANILKKKLLGHPDKAWNSLKPEWPNTHGRMDLIQVYLKVQYASLEIALSTSWQIPSLEQKHCKRITFDPCRVKPC